VEFGRILQESVNVVRSELNRSFDPISNRTAERVQFCLRLLEFGGGCRSRLNLSWFGCGKYVDAVVYQKQTAADQNDPENKYGDSKG
jgi:hypothetical protein